MKARMPIDWLKPDGTWRDAEGRIVCHYCARRLLEMYTICVHCKTPHNDGERKYFRKNYPQFHEPVRETPPEART